MKLPSGKWPSTGILLIVVSYFLLTGFIVFGLRTPRLERFWELEKQLRVGRMGCLSPEDKNFMEDVLADHRALAKELLGNKNFTVLSAQRQGWSTVPCIVHLRSPSPSSDRLRLQLEAPEKKLPAKLRLVSGSWSRELVLERRGYFDIELEPAGHRSQILQLEVEELGTDEFSEPIRLKVEKAE